jgi:hypothetical protein
MASTYSALKIQLMGTGENSGTWGNVTNVNLGTALEEAIVGSADVTFASGTVTLALTDANSSQTARNLRLNLTGTSGGAQNLVVPAIEKVYIVNNGCADTITVKNTGGTGIAVPAGKTMYVYNDGTNVVDAVTHLTSLTLGTALPNSSTTASASNGASTIVARDAAGSFTANVITANGSALTSLNASNISSGTVPTARLGSGTADNTTFLRGDQTYAVVSSGTLIPSGTVMIFGQTSAPTGFTKLTNQDNAALRVVSGSASTGGSVDFTVAFASQTPTGSVSVNTSSLSAGATTLNTAQMPSHNHTIPIQIGSGCGAAVSAASQGPSAGQVTGNTGGGGSHTHSISGSATATFTGTAINLAVKYVDVIRATKD